MAAVRQELSLLESELGEVDRVESPFHLTCGRIGQQRLLLCRSGVGKANAAAAACWLLERYSPEVLIITGCGGAYLQSGLTVGELAMATEEIFADEGVITPDGWLDLQQMGLPLAEGIHNIVPLTADFNLAAAALAEQGGVKLRFGRFATLSSCSGTEQRGVELENRYQVICENMEGAAAALVAYRYRTCCLELRGISNLVEDRDFSRWRIDLATENAQRFLLRFLQNPGNG